MPSCDNKAGFGTLSLKNGIGCNRCAMMNVVKFAIPRVRLFQQLSHLVDPLLNGDTLVGDICGHLGGNSPALRRDDADIGEGSLFVALSGGS